MKKAVFTGVIVGIVVLALGAAGLAYARTQSPMAPYYQQVSDEGYPYGSGMMGRGMMGMGGYNSTFGSGFAGPMMDGDENGPIHEYMIESLADALGIDSTELETRHDAGETLWDIAQEQGISQEDFYALVQSARSEALDQAVADGVITQEQADWMLDHMAGTGGFGPGMMGHGQGSFSGEGEGPLHDYMAPAIADAFGLTVDELEALHTSGETLWDYAQEQDINQDEFTALLEGARTDAIDQAVADGVITQEQADWMLDHMGKGFGPGNGECHDGFGVDSFGPGMNGPGQTGNRIPGGRWNTQP